MEMAGVVKHQTRNAPLDGTRISVLKHIPQASSVNAIGKRSLTTGKIMQGWQQVPLHHGYITLRLRLDTGTGHYKRDTQPAFESRTLSIP